MFSRVLFLKLKMLWFSLVLLLIIDGEGINICVSDLELNDLVLFGVDLIFVLIIVFWFWFVIVRRVLFSREIVLVDLIFEELFLGIFFR